MMDVLIIYTTTNDRFHIGLRVFYNIYHFNIEDIIDHFIVYILNTMEISWRSTASPQTSNLEKKEVKYTEIDDLAYH